MEPKYLFVPKAPELGPMFVINDEPTPMDLLLAVLETRATITRLSDRTRLNPDTQEWEALAPGTELPDIANLPIGVLAPPPHGAGRQIHVHPSKVARTA